MLPIIKMTEKVSTFRNKITEETTDNIFNFKIPTAKEKRAKLDKEEAELESQRFFRVQTMIHNILPFIQKQLTRDTCLDFTRFKIEMRDIYKWGGRDCEDLRQAFSQIERILNDLGYQTKFCKNNCAEFDEIADFTISWEKTY